MTKSLGDYNIEQSSSADVNNIKWSKKNPHNTGKPKNKKKNPISPTNIIYKNEIKPDEKKVFKVEDDAPKKPKKKKIDKKFQTSSSSNYPIEQGFRRPGR